jgi:hypothetical protein
MMAPFTITPDFFQGYLKNYGYDTHWKVAATTTFRQYSESFFSTCAVLLGLQIKGSA